MRCINKGKHIKIEDVNGCAVCTSHEPNKDGYIRMYSGKGNMPRMQFLHRMVWEGYNGTIPEGYEVDHICRNRKCCNIKHLQLLTVSEHKAKTNKERYADKIEAVKAAIKMGGFSTRQLAETFKVSLGYITRYKRSLRDIH